MQAFLVNLLLRLVGSLVTKELVKDVVNFLLARLRDVVKQSETKLDDEALDIVEKVLHEDAFIEDLVKFLNDRLKNNI